MIKTYKNILTKEHKIFFKYIFEKEIVPFYVANQAVSKNDKGFHFIHHAIHRDRPNIDNSGIAPSLRKILKEILDKLNINYTKIYRCAINITFNNGYVKECKPHFDHLFDHKQIIIYLDDTDGETVFVNEKNKKIKSIKPEKYKIVITDKIKHFMVFPKKGIRKVLIYTIDNV